MIRKYTPDDREKIKHLYRDELFPEPTLSFYFDKHFKPFVYEEDGKILGSFDPHSKKTKKRNDLLILESLRK